MAKIARYTGNLAAFGSEAAGTERTVFGDVAQSDVLDDNINADFLRGWGIVGVNENPTKQDFNAATFTATQLVAYLHQMGVAEWDIAQEYHEGSVAQRGGGLFVSVIDTNVGNDPAVGDTAKWVKISALQANSLASLKATTPTAGQTVSTNYRSTLGDGGGGDWYADMSDLSAEVAADTLSGIYAAPDSDPTGASGAWVRRLDGHVTPQMFGAAGDGVTDDSAAIQAAINSGLTVDFIGKHYAASGLTQSLNGQSFVSSSGVAEIVKNANGVIFSGSGDDLYLNNLSFRGDAATPVYTGDNVVLSGDNPVIENCGSRWAYGRALKATGNRVRVLNTCDIYQTSDATATGYDIEIGSSGVATLYHELSGVISSQNTGGILLIDTGSHTIRGGQFGKLTIQAGTSPAGVNGGKTIGARILNDVDIELSDAVFTANQFGALVNLTFAVGTSQCSIDLSNVWAVGSTVTNNGNANNLVVRQVSTGSLYSFRYGDDTAAAKHIDITPGGPIEVFHNFRMQPGFNLQWENGAGGYNTVAQATTTIASFGNSGLQLAFAGNNIQTYAVTNVTTDRSYDADTVAIAELADVVGTLIEDLRALGLVD